MPATFPEYADHDATGLAELIRKGEVSAVEVIEAAIERIERDNPRLNAVIHRSFERARDQAAAMVDPQAPLAGVPTLLKDLRGCDRGQPVTSGSRFAAGRVADHTDALVERFRRGGLVVLGRTNTPEFGIMGITEPRAHGPCRNPWNVQHTPGGSSGGSAAAVASGMVPIAHASDGGGSIRIPASHCGLFGLKVSRGRTPMGPRTGEGWGGLSVEFVVSRSVRDSALALDLVHGPDPGPPYGCPPPIRPYVEEIVRDPARLRIAYSSETLFAGTSDPEAVRAVHDAAELARQLGHEVVEDRPTFDRAGLVRAYMHIVGAGVAVTLRELVTVMGRPPRAGEIEAVTAVFAALGEHSSAATYLDAVGLAQRTHREIAPFFERYDLFLTATVARPPARVGELYPGRVEQALARLVSRVPARILLDRVVDLADKQLSAVPNTQLFNLTGQPAMSVPLHWTADGLPLGTQWAAAYGREDLLLGLAAQLERARPWRDRRPVGW